MTADFPPQPITAAELESEPLDNVLLEPLVLSKIIQNGESGVLLGIDERDTLHITQCFPSQEGENYESDMLNLYKNLNMDANPVGFYTNKITGSTLETLYHYQKEIPNSVMIYYFNGELQALRMSEAFFKLYPEKMSKQVLKEHGLSAHNMLQTFSIEIRESPLVEAMMLQANVMDPTFKRAKWEVHLEYLADCLEEYGQEQWRWQSWHRSFVKEVAKKKAEGADLSILLPKLQAQEPGRLEGLTLEHQMSLCCKQLK